MAYAQRFVSIALPMIVLAAWLAGGVPAHAATIYKWTDQNGDVHYSDTLPARTKSEIVKQANLTVIPGTVVPARPSVPPAARDDDAAKDQQEALKRELAERRERLIQLCERNHGVECAVEVDTELDAERIQALGHVIHLAPPR